MIVRARPFLHPLHAILLAFPIALFAAGLAADITYLDTAEMQWSNMAAWAITGALIFGGLVLLWSLVAVFRHRGGRGRAPYLIVVAVMWMLGLVNAFQHSRDAWSSVGTIGLILSILTTLLALAAGWIGHSTATGQETAR